MPARFPLSDLTAQDDAAQRRVALLAERRRHVRALLLLAAIILIASIARAGLPRTFYPGWWKQW